MTKGHFVSMDTLSHALWATATGKGINLRSPEKIRLGWIALWGILPDLFAFTPVVLWMLWQLDRQVPRKPRLACPVKYEV